MLGFEFVEQIPELIVMKALLDGISHVAAKSARASPGADGLSQLPRQGDADFFHLSVQARPRNIVWIGCATGQDSDDSLEHLLAGVGLQCSPHCFVKSAERRQGLVVVCCNSHGLMLPPVAMH